MSGWRSFLHLMKSSPKSDIIVLVLSFVLTVVFDLVLAIEVGILLAAILFMKRMSEVTEVKAGSIWTRRTIPTPSRFA